MSALAPDMRAYVRGLQGETITTVAQGRPNRIVRLTADRALVETETGSSYTSLTELQALADRIYSGEEVVLEARGRSAFYAAVLATLPDLEYATSPRRFWLRDSPATFGAEYDELFPDEHPIGALEGRAAYIRHRRSERSPILRRQKIDRALAEHGRLRCEACDHDFVTWYGELGEGFMECHHLEPLADGGERTTTIDDLALVCSNCHRMIHRSKPMLTPDQLRDIICEELAERLDDFK